MSRSALYAVNTADQALTVGNVVNFGSIVRRFGCNCNLSAGNAVTTGAGYYDLEANFTFTANATGNALIALYKDGIVIPGAEMTITVTNGDVYAATIPAVIRNTCCADSTITAVLSGVAATINNAAIIVEKL